MPWMAASAPRCTSVPIVICQRSRRHCFKPRQSPTNGIRAAGRRCTTLLPRIAWPWLKPYSAGGADPKSLSACGGTPLHEAAASGSAEMVQLLLAAGVDPSVQAANGERALSIAVASQNKSAIQLLQLSN